MIDTNVCLRVAAHRTDILFSAWRAEKFEWVTSAELIEEFVRVATEPKIVRFLPTERAAFFARLLLSQATLVRPATAIPPCRDPMMPPSLAQPLQPKPTIW